MSMNVADEANVKDIIKSINGTTMGASASAYVSARFEDATGNTVITDGVSVSSIQLNYGAAYASRANADVSKGETGYDFDNASDNFVTAKVDSQLDGNLDGVPANNTSQVSIAQTSTDKWSFTFNMEGIGEVTATSSAIRYYGNHRAADDVDVWWEWKKGKNGPYVSTIPKYTSEYGDGTLGSIMAALTGDDSSTSMGLLNKSEGGYADDGGYIYLEFDVNSTNGYSYGSVGNSNDIGTMTLRINVEKTDTEQTVLDKINTALNSATVIDLYTSSSNINSVKHRVSASSVKNSTVDHDVYDLEPDYQNVHVNIHTGLLWKIRYI